MCLNSVDLQQCFDFSYFRLALHTKKQPTKIENIVQYFFYSML